MKLLNFDRQFIFKIYYRAGAYLYTSTNSEALLTMDVDGFNVGLVLLLRLYSLINALIFKINDRL